MINAYNNYEALSKPEQRKLKSILRKEQGSLAEAVETSGVTAPTLNRAAAGMKVRPETSHKIRTVLLNQKLETIS